MYYQATLQIIWDLSLETITFTSLSLLLSLEMLIMLQELKEYKGLLVDLGLETPVQMDISMVLEMETSKDTMENLDMEDMLEDSREIMEELEERVPKQEI